VGWDVGIGVFGEAVGE
jgi:hypothetical protein